ncbi:hypothetical protein J6590_108031, partial [Homalodisca vitripennis]
SSAGKATLADLIVKGLNSPPRTFNRTPAESASRPPLPPPTPPPPPTSAQGHNTYAEAVTQRPAGASTLPTTKTRRTKLTNKINQQQKRSKFQNHDSIRLLHQNAQLATNKLDEIQLMCEDLQTDVLVVTENGFNHKNIDRCQISKFKLANSYCRQLSKGGGVAIFAKTDFTFDTVCIKETIQKDFEAVGIKIHTTKSKLAVIGIY